MTDNVSNIRDGKGRFPKGVSGNPHGVSAKERAIRDMQRHNEELLGALVAKHVPSAVRLHKTLLKNGANMTAKEAIQLIELTYKYGIGTPRQADAMPRTDDDSDFDFSTIPAEKRQAMIDLLNGTAEDAAKE